MRGIKESPWIIHYDASSCNGCDIETLACLTPLYDVERLGVINTDLALRHCQAGERIHDQENVLAASAKILRDCGRCQRGANAQQR